MWRSAEHRGGRRVGNFECPRQDPADRVRLGKTQEKGEGGYSVVAEKDEGNAHAPPMFSHS
jgi:hypothetical protein